MTNYDQYQLNKYGDILPEPNMQIEEPGEKEAQRFAEWTSLQREIELKESE